MGIGYSVRLCARNENADHDLLGVQLGTLCIQRDIPVSQVAKELRVSRATVYNWFCGATSPQSYLQAQIRAFMAAHSEA
jgi:transcriptional regulator with XRE-family HTH domain